MNKKKKIHDDYIKAGSTTISAAELRRLSNSELPAVRRRVAENEKTPADLLIKLAKDRSAEVRMAVALNKTADRSVIEQLAMDENADVRFLIASTSYIPKNTLKKLAKDLNPHVAQRAGTTLAQMGNKLGRMITIFEFLCQDHAMLSNKLEESLKSFSRYSLDKRFDMIVEILDGIRRHFDRQQTLCLDWIEEFEPESSSLKRSLERNAAEHARLMEVKTDLLMQHVDGPNFEDGLRKLQEQVRKHINFSENELFVEVKKALSPQELDAMNLALNRALLEGPAA